MKDNKWLRLLAYVTGLVNQELLLQNEYLAAENRILRAHLPARLTGSSRKVGKTSKVLELLKRPHRATLPELMKATGWQPHSIRGSRLLCATRCDAGLGMDLRPLT